MLVVEQQNFANQSSDPHFYDPEASYTMWPKSFEYSIETSILFMYLGTKFQYLQNLSLKLYLVKLESKEDFRKNWPQYAKFNGFMHEN